MENVLSIKISDVVVSSMSSGPSKDPYRVDQSCKIGLFGVYGEGGLSDTANVTIYADGVLGRKISVLNLFEEYEIDLSIRKKDKG